MSGVQRALSRMKLVSGLRFVALLCTLCSMMLMADTSVAARDLFPFLINTELDQPDNITNVSAWLEKPAGKYGFIKADGSHFVTESGQRIRFFGVNFTFDSAFPDHAAAEKLARQLARYGVNLVRFHHLDMDDAPRGIWQPGVYPRRFDPQQLDRLDYFVAQLKKNGIYSNLNLHVSRTMSPQEGFPEPERRPSYDKGLDIFHPQIIAHQQEYAKNLLTHLNPYTGNRYVEEPAIAMIEITNEDGLIRQWEEGGIDALPDEYQAPLDALWQDWLRERYGTTQALCAAWGGIASQAQSGGPELLANGDLQNGTGTWTMETDAQAKATMQVVEGAGPSVATPEVDRKLPALQVNVLQKGEVFYRPQFHHTKLTLEPGKNYVISFWLKADQPRQITANVRMNHTPWNIFWWERLELSSRWEQFKFSVQIPSDAVIQEARIGFTDVEADATYWLAGVSIREMDGDGVGLPEGESLAHTVRRPRRAELGARTAAVRSDYMAFLWDVENAYFQNMYRYIKDELGARAPISGTQVGYSAPAIQARLDYVDAHAYWNHPVFPLQPWDPRDWYILNDSMVTSADGGNVRRLAGIRVAGKPYVISEYNHPAPITFGSEAFLLMGAYSAYQDWDGLFAYHWTNSGDFWPFRMRGYFNIESHPTKLVTLPAVAALFLRGDVAVADEVLSVMLDEQTQLQVLTTKNLGSVRTDAAGVPTKTALVRRLELVTQGGTYLAPDQNDNRVQAITSLAGSVVSSDTHELHWDLSEPNRGVVVIDTLLSKAVIGYGGNRLFDLSGVRVTPGATSQDGWSAITLTVMKGNSFTDPGRILLTATGYVENAGMVWEKLDQGRVTVRDRWGQGPPMVEGVAGRVELPLPAEFVRVYALDQAGERRQDVPVQTTPEGRSLFAIGPQYRTLWYEIEITKR